MQRERSETCVRVFMETDVRLEGIGVTFDLAHGPNEFARLEISASLELLIRRRRHRPGVREA